MNKNWHTLPLVTVLSKTKSALEGLSELEARRRLQRFGPNALPHKKPYSKTLLLFSQFNNPLMYILITTVAISFLLGHHSDSVFILIVILLNTAVSFYQENKANESLTALKQMVKVRARVFRDGREKEIDSTELVIGDVVVVSAGNKIPADCRIISSKNLRVNEASLTGESGAVKKEGENLLAQGASISEQTNMLFMGTIVEEGAGRAVVVETGVTTQIGNIVALLKETKERRTPLQVKIDTLSRTLGIFILFVILLIVAIGFITGEQLADIFIAALALAVSAIPEGLLPAITVILVLGMRRIFKHNGLVRKLAATETLGSVTVICTDKTGTLTEGKMHVSHILTSTHELLHSDLEAVAGREKGEEIESHLSALKIAVLTNEAFIENPDAELQEWIIRGKPTERALLLAGMQAGLNKNELEEKMPRLDGLMFTSETKYALSLHQIDKSTNVLYMIGAPEQIIARSTHIDIDGKHEKLGSVQANTLLEKFESLTQRGLRVLACAHKNYSASTSYENLAELGHDLALVGFIAIKDPLRKDAKESIALTKRAGIKTIIITGDHRLTAKTIAEEVGIIGEDHGILEGKDLDTLSDKELRERARVTNIYARVSPHHKLRIVKALQDDGEIVAMVGDGVNDAPALKAADIGISVGSGTDVAKEVADLVLLDDSFKTIIKAIEQGRVIFQNIRKVFVYLVADNFSALSLFLGTMAFGLPLPLLPAQILWINLVEDGLPGIALTAEQETNGIMDEKPRDPREPIINKPIKQWITSVFIISSLAAFVSFFILWKLSGDINKTRTVVFALMCLDSLVFAFSVRSFTQSIFRKSIFSNKNIVWGVGISFLLLLLSIYATPLQTLLGTQALSATEWCIISIVVFTEVLLIEFFRSRSFAR